MHVQVVADRVHVRVQFNVQANRAENETAFHKRNEINFRFGVIVESESCSVYIVSVWWIHVGFDFRVCFKLDFRSGGFLLHPDVVDLL
jgi:hypothetical protein